MLLDGFQKVLAHDGGLVGRVGLLAVLLGDHGFQLGLVPQAHGVLLVRLVVVVDVALRGGVVPALARHDVHLVRETTLLRGFRAAPVLEVLAQDGLGVHPLRHFLLLDGDALRAQQELLSLLRRLARGARGGLAQLRRRIVHVLQPLRHDLVLRLQTFLLAERHVLVRQLLHPARLLTLLLLHLFVAHTSLLRLQAVLLRGSLPHGGCEDAVATRASKSLRRR
mmetsp:Transcript_10591/g.45107  ORF Transcript_10591/g.45107 Transcript_10591/m.45107 type:complete len:223 (+) Transcript_10591:1696-2364(+)